MTVIPPGLFFVLRCGTRVQRLEGYFLQQAFLSQNPELLTRAGRRDVLRTPAEGLFQGISKASWAVAFSDEGQRAPIGVEGAGTL